ncbi:c-type cytochrome [Noviherbaspirillum denitrificans]|uniref:Cytochrome c domain-containing protein n=1 Tax=Noviherbaspirillum denitrificans TaxID=1968433 RepID=A0A254T8S9_9BURK|nr:cytochrome c [Noviherbaspirillum denitrificans]OWW19061.1 hypothetical protein AYR66_05705 [Noviherbaspirillum denitrificans]
MKTPLVLALSAFVLQPAVADSDIDGGRKLYHATCAMCHGQELKAAGGIPDLRKTALDDQGFYAVVKEGRPGTIMPPMKQALNDEEIGRIRAYVKAAARE